MVDLVLVTANVLTARQRPVRGRLLVATLGIAALQVSIAVFFLAQ